MMEDGDLSGFELIRIGFNMDDPSIREYNKNYSQFQIEQTLDMVRSYLARMNMVLQLPSNVCSMRWRNLWRSESTSTLVEELFILWTFRFLVKMCRWIPMGSIYFFSIVLMPSEEKLATFPQFYDALRKSFPSFQRKMAFPEEKFSIPSVKFWGKVKNGNRLDFAKHGKYYK